MRKGYMKVSKRWRRSPNNCVGFGLSGSSPTKLGDSITKPKVIALADKVGRRMFNDTNSDTIIKGEMTTTNAWQALKEKE